MQHVGTEACELPTYEGLPILAYFLTEFDNKVTEHQHLSALEFALKLHLPDGGSHINNLSQTGLSAGN